MCASQDPLLTDRPRPAGDSRRRWTPRVDLAPLRPTRGGGEDPHLRRARRLLPPRVFRALQSDRGVAALEWQLVESQEVSSWASSSANSASTAALSVSRSATPCALVLSTHVSLSHPPRTHFNFRLFVLAPSARRSPRSADGAHGGTSLSWTEGLGRGKCCFCRSVVVHPSLPLYPRCRSRRQHVLTAPNASPLLITCFFCHPRELVCCCSSSVASCLKRDSSTCPPPSLTLPMPHQQRRPICPA